MSNEKTQAEKEAPPHDSGPDHGKDEVTITVDNKSIQIHRGRTTVLDIKLAAHIHPADTLEQIVDGKLVPLPDDGAVTIKGHEVFVSHPKDNGSA